LYIILSKLKKIDLRDFYEFLSRKMGCGASKLVVDAPVSSDTKMASKVVEVDIHRDEWRGAGLGDFITPSGYY
jgi:hypothetical protein